MKKVKVKIPAKINLTLDVFEKSGGFHEINSLVASINVFDEITLKKRNDKKVTFKNEGVSFSEKDENNNAVKSVKAVMEKYSLFGADIKIKRGIPIGAGLGSSSADIAGTLLAMQKLYGTGEVLSIASALGSDVTYMMQGGYAVLKGKGDSVEKVNSKAKLYLLILPEEKGVSAGECYKKFDELNVKTAQKTEKAKLALESEDINELGRNLSNDLYIPAKTLVPEIENNLEELKKYSFAVMTGSGSCTYAVFATKKERNVCYKKLKHKFKGRLIKAQTII